VGLLTTDHVTPFHDSMRASLVVVVVESPTAVQETVVGHDTAHRMLLAAPDASGLGTTVQDDPFHVSTRVWPTDDPADCPTAVHWFPPAPVGHEIASRMLEGLPAGFGLATTDHAPEDAPAGTAVTAAVTPAETSVTAAHTATASAARVRLPVTVVERSDPRFSPIGRLLVPCPDREDPWYDAPRASRLFGRRAQGNRHTL